jgi:uncharacterized protein with ATP-grasp and redox domains
MRPVPVPDCVPDALAQALDAARQVSDDPFIHRKVMLKAMAALAEDGDLGEDAAEIAFTCLSSAYGALGVKDPYEKEKARSNRAMLGLEKHFAAYCDGAPTRLQGALALSLAGAMADFDVLGRAEAEREILERLELRPARDDREALLAALSKAERVLFAVDRAGEILLDKLLVREIARRAGQTRVVVASRPILAMATAEDARAAGLADLEGVEIMDPGAWMLGLAPEKASTALQAAFAEADVVVAKGEAHFQALSMAGREVFFILRARCPHMARALRVPEGGGAVARWPDERVEERA